MHSFESFEFPYFDEMKYFCLKNCFYQNMEYLNIEDSLLHIKLGLQLKLLNNDSIFNTYKHELLMPLFDMNSVEVGFGCNFDVEFEKNIQSLPVIVLVDVYYLPYRQEYHKYHASHTVFLTGFSQDKKTVRIIDWYSYCFYKGDVNFDDFKLARISQNPKDINPFSGFEIKNYWYKIKPEKLCINSIENVHKNLLDMKQSIADDGKGIYTGVYAFEKIASYMEKHLQIPDAPLKTVCKHIHDDLFIFYRATVLAKRYFEYARLRFPNDIELSHIKFIEGVSDTIEKTNFFLLKGSISGSNEMLKKSKILIENIIHAYNQLGA